MIYTILNLGQSEPQNNDISYLDCKAHYSPWSFESEENKDKKEKSDEWF